MSWLGDFAGEIAGSLFPGSRAIVTKFINRAVDAVVSAGKRLVETWINNTGVNDENAIVSAQKAQRSKAQELADEERYLGEKFIRDGYRKPADADRLQQITVEREDVGAKIGETSALKAAQDIAATGNLISVPASLDELVTQVGILSTKQCERCGGLMTLQVGENSKNVGQKIYWNCTAANPLYPHREWVRPSDVAPQISVREPHADLDISSADRRKALTDKGVLAETAGRVRAHLGKEDEAILCPVHHLPMKLLPVANPGGLILDSYQYTCLCVQADGRACNQTLPVKSFGQVSGLLTRLEGRGIL